MVPRLAKEEQERVDSSWNNMFSPPGRLNRVLLLETILAHGFHQVGVDRLQLVSEKRLADGMVVMEVYFDRERPAFDTFTVTLYDAKGVERRRERYTREEVEHRCEALGRMATIAHVRADEVDAERREEFEKQQVWCVRRLEQIAAATQPAAQPDDAPSNAPGPKRPR